MSVQKQRTKASANMQVDHHLSNEQLVLRAHGRDWHTQA